MVPPTGFVIRSVRGSGASRYSRAVHSVRRIYDCHEAIGATVEIDHVLYWMFGDVQNFSAMNTTPLFLYTGREWDADVNLYYYRAPWYRDTPEAAVQAGVFVVWVRLG
jgi:hypothetical protein